MRFVQIAKSESLHLETDGRAVCGRVGGEVVDVDVERAGAPGVVVCRNCTRVAQMRRERAQRQGQAVAAEVVIPVATEADILRAELARERAERAELEERVALLRERNRAHVQRLERLVAEKAETDRANARLREVNTDKAARLAEIEKAGGAGGLAMKLAAEREKVERLTRALADARVAANAAKGGGAK